LFLLLVLEHALFLPRILAKAGLPRWVGAVPGLNYWGVLRAIGRPWYWLLVLPVPGINLIMFTVMHVELGSALGFKSPAQRWFSALLPWLALPKWAGKEGLYQAPTAASKKPTTAWGEWRESIIWAVVVASMVRMLLFEAFTIPTGSMEGSMLVGDYLYVSKTAYGPKVPQTPISVPFVHNVIPGTMWKSYTDWFSLPYLRLPGWRGVERMDAVVFNFPHGDTIVVDPELAGHDYYAILRREGMQLANNDLDLFLENQESFLAQAREKISREKGISGRPIDKEENYVKRCVGLPGDLIEIRNRQVFINDAPLEQPEGIQYDYVIRFAKPSDAQRAYKAMGLTQVDVGFMQPDGEGLVVDFALTESERKRLEESGLALEIKPLDHLDRRGTLEMFPNVSSPEFDQWDPDNVGPIRIPKRGLEVELTERNLALYDRVIRVYEGRKLERKEGEVYIDGQVARTYTFQQDYYWMMGDNRHRSADSRMWGFVPETHLVGRASFIWFSRQNAAQHGESKIRWDRVFTTVK
jgi:signal peptidase I